MKRAVVLILSLVFVASFVWAGGSQEPKTSGAAANASSAPVTIDFTQWWEPELPAGSLRALMDQFQTQNPGVTVKLVSGPYSTTHDQIIAGAATGTLSDVVGLDGAWVSDLAKQGAIAPMDSLMSSTNFDPAQVAAIIKIKGKSYMFPVASFVYPVFINLDLFKAAGIANPPTTRSEFAQDAKVLTDPAKNQYGWVLPLSLQNPNGAQNDVMSWVWASGKSMLKDGQPDLTNSNVVDALKFIASMYSAGVVVPGSFTMQEQDKVEQFVNGHVGMMIDSLAHINMIRTRNPKLNFTISALPATDGYTGKRGLPYAAWGIGISANSKHQAEAWKLVSYLMSTDVNSKIASLAHAFPGNVNSKPDYVSSDAMYAKAFQIFQSGYLANEFVGLPVAEQLMRQLDEQVQLLLSGKESAEQAAANAQAKWVAEF